MGAGPCPLVRVGGPLPDAGSDAAPATRAPADMGTGWVSLVGRVTVGTAVRPRPPILLLEVSVPWG